MTPVILHTKLCLGGVWYRTGQRVDMIEKDAEDYIALRLATPAPVDIQPRKQFTQAPVEADGTAPVKEPEPTQPVQEPTPVKDIERDQVEAAAQRRATIVKKPYHAKR
jgi:hypothetical protein